MDKFYIRKNMQQPHYVAEAIGGDGEAINLTGAVVFFKMKNARTGTVVTSGSALVDSASGGLMRYVWAASDTAEEGVFKATFEVYSLMGGPFSVPRLPDEEAFVIVHDL